MLPPDVPRSVLGQLLTAAKNHAQPHSLFKSQISRTPIVTYSLLALASVLPPDVPRSVLEQLLTAAKGDVALACNRYFDGKYDAGKPEKGVCVCVCFWIHLCE